MTNKISSGRGKKIVTTGKIATLKKGRAVATRRAGEKVNALKRVSRSVKSPK